MQCTTRPRITELNPHLLCVLCGGYYVDATAIIECLHSFCKSCIVRYLETHKYCPICDVLVHKSKPLQNIRPDKILQSIVYKLVPNLYEKEMCNRRKFYVQVHPQNHPLDPESKGEITTSSFFSSNDTINLSLEYINFLGDQNFFYVASSSKRYLRCQASVTVKNLRKLIAAKYALACKHEIRFFFNGIQLPEHLTLLDIAYISSWKRGGFIRLLYQILEVRKTVIKVENKEAPKLRSEETKVDKLSLDVENRVDNIITIDNRAKEANDDLKLTLPVVTSVIESSTITAVSIIATSNCVNSFTSSLSSLTTVVTSTPATICTSKINENSALNKIVQILEKKASDNEVSRKNAEKVNDMTSNDTSKSINSTVSNDEELCKTEKENNELKKELKSEITNIMQTTDAKIELKKKTEDPGPIPPKIPKLVNNVDGVAKTNEDICKEIKLVNTPIMSVSTVSTQSIIPSNPVIPVLNYSVSNNKATTVRKIPIGYPQRVNCVENKDGKSSKEIVPGVHKINDLPAMIKKPMKTSKTFTRPWNSTTTTVAVKPTMADSKNEQKSVKFFKARNTPRFLGNPLSGIRPIYEVNPTNAKNESNDVAKKTLKNVSVVKIDPKTLCPIVSSSAGSNTSSIKNSKKSFPFIPSSLPKLYPSTVDYPVSTNSPNYAGNLPAITSSAIIDKLPSASFPYSNMNHNSLLTSIPPFFFGMYPATYSTTESEINGPTSLDLMKAMAAFHPSFPASINPLYNPHSKLKHDKSPKLNKALPSPPAVQRIPPSNNTKTSSSESTSDNMKTTSSATSVSNGMYKSKNKKSEMSSFAINNLIPLEETKNITHECTADGIHQICDQVKADDAKESQETDKQKPVIEKNSQIEEQKDVEIQKSVSN